MAKKNIGLFFGSFNPIHIGHLIIANYIVEHVALDEVWFVVSPHNPFKEKKSLANMYDRLEMVNLALDKSEKLRASDIEFSLPQPSYTVDTLVHLREKHPDYGFKLIMGQDNLNGLQKWKNAEILLRDYGIIVYPRLGCDSGELTKHPSVTITDTPQIEISSTFIRRLRKDNKSIKYLTADVVIDFIERKGLYL